MNTANFGHGRLFILLFLSSLMLHTQAADIRYTFTNIVQNVGFSIEPAVAEVGDVMEISFTGPENPSNIHPNTEIYYNSGNLYSMEVRVDGSVIYSTTATLANLVVQAPNGSNTHIARWGGGEPGIDGTTVGVVMRFNPGFFEFFPTAESVLNPNLVGLDTNSSMGLCFDGLDVESCVSAFNISSYTYQILISDGDGDGFGDDLDNCISANNPSQTDTDSDGFGNACDPDINNDCAVNFVDISAFANEFLGTNPLFDFNSDGAVNFVDFGVMTAAFGQPPGPSALASCAD